MRKIVLHGPAVDRRDHFRDAGETLTVGASDNDDTDVSTETADDLLARGVAVTMTEDRQADAAAETVIAEAPETPVLNARRKPAVSADSEPTV